MASKTIDDWCRSHGFSRTFYYQLKARDEAPREIRIGRCVRISDDADREWVAAHERRAPAPVAA